MSTQVEHIEGLAPLRRPAGLSQEIVAGLVAIGDGMSVVLAALLVNVAYRVVLAQSLFPPAGLVLLAVVLLLLTLHTAGLYRFTAIMRPRNHVGTAVTLALVIALALVGLGQMLKIAVPLTRGWALWWLLGSALLLVGLRFAMATALHRLAEAGRLGRRIVIYGGGPLGERLVQRIDSLNEPWNRIVGVFDDRRSRGSDSAGKYRIAGSLNDLLDWGHRDRPDEVLVALPWSAEERILEILHRLAAVPANVRLAPEFQRLDMIQGRTNSQFGLPMLNAYEKPVEGWGRVWKRLFDISLAVAAIVAAAPLLLLIALLIRVESPGPVLFSQPRFGFNSKLINVFKFRTMRAEASDALGQKLTERGDCRITRVGALLRRLSLDELPQLINVLKGEMSLVGPRPHAIRTTAGGRQCDAVVDQYAVRHKVKPGITGWAQVNGWRGTMETEQQLVKRLEHDLYYINNWSALFDVKILLMTVWAVLNGRNSF